jgi:hypothetical protein
VAIYFTGASSQYLRNASPILTDYPFSVGLWVNLAAVGAVGRVLFSLTDTGSTNNYVKLQMSAGELVQQSAAAGGTANIQTATAGTQLSVGTWAFVVLRAIASTERRTSIFQPSEDLPVHHISTTAARAPTGMDTMLIGAHETSGGIEEPWDGGVAEFWLARGDVGSSGADLPSALLLQLALGGPFSVPHVRRRVVDYRSFHSGVAGGRSDKIGWVDGFGKRQVWAVGNGPLRLAPHVPLPYWYERPGQTQRPLVI